MAERIFARIVVRVCFGWHRHLAPFALTLTCTAAKTSLRPFPSPPILNPFRSVSDLSFLMIHKFIALVGRYKFFRAFFRSPDIVCLLGEASDKVVLEVVRV